MYVYGSSSRDRKLKGKEQEALKSRRLLKAWNKKASERDGRLAELINDSFEKISGHRADCEQIVNFINRHVKTIADGGAKMGS